MIKTIFTLHFLLVCLMVFPKQTKICGFVKDSLSGEPLIGASIYCLNHKTWAQSDGFGFYILSISQGKYDLQISCLGYEKTNANGIAFSDTSIDLLLKPGDVFNPFLDSACILPPRARKPHNTYQIGAKGIEASPVFILEFGYSLN